MTGRTIHEYIGSIHVHSNYSDGLKPIPEIARMAEKCGLDFLLFADHMTLAPLKDGMERWFGPVLSIIGYEINDPDNKNHYLVYGLKDILPTDLKAQDYVRLAHEAGAIGFIAHPDEKRSAIPEHPPYPWTAWDVRGFDGVEIWNHSSEWLERINNMNKYLWVLHPLKYLKGPAPETLARWDKQNREGMIPGIGGTDAHAFPYRFGPFTIYIFRYKVLFKGIRTHILLEQELNDDVDNSKTCVLNALKNARCFISNYRWGDARGFRFEAFARERVWFMGDTITAENADFKVSVPENSSISLLRDGKVIAQAGGVELFYRATRTGAYRVEVRRKKRPWIYSNHIRLLSENHNDAQ